jgi:hypothetical protein
MSYFVIIRLKRFLFFHQLCGVDSRDGSTNAKVKKPTHPRAEFRPVLTQYLHLYKRSI